MTMPRPSFVTSSGPSPVRGFIAAILPSPSSRLHARRRAPGAAPLRGTAPSPQSRVPAAEPASHNRFYPSPYYPVFGSRMVMIGQARCRPGARTGLFAGRSAIALARRVIGQPGSGGGTGGSRRHMRKPGHMRKPRAREGAAGTGGSRGHGREPRAREGAASTGGSEVGGTYRPPRDDRPRPLRRSRDLRCLVPGELVSVLGTQLTTVAVPYQVYQLTRSSLDMGLVSLAQLFPLIAGSLPQESVHHRNGVHEDNRPENLELSTRPQPAGIRVSDAVAWAREIRAGYTGVSDTSNNALGRP
jgi:hypothetical protein